MLRGRRGGRRRAVRRDPGAAALRAACSTCRRRLGPRSSCAASWRDCSRATELHARRCRFLGGGCWQHYVPAVVDEIVNRARVRHRLLRRDVHRSRQAAGALRVREPDRRARGAGRGQPADVRLGDGGGERDLHGGPRDGPRPRARAGVDGAGAPLGRRGRLRAAGSRSSACRTTESTGQLDLDALEAALGDDVACVYVENPGFLGVMEAEAPAIGRPPTRRARSSSSASTRSRSACSRRRRATAPTSSAASCSRSACTCTSAAASAGFIATPDEERFVGRVPDVPGRASRHGAQGE